MTAQKHRRPGTVEEAITRVIDRMGADAAGQAIERSGSLIRQASDPDADFSLSVKHCIALDAAYQAETGEPGPIGQAFAIQVEKRAGGQPRHEPAEPLERVIEVMKEGAEAADQYRACHPDSTPHMRNRALAEIADVVEAYQNMARDIEAQDRPAVLRPVVAE